MDKQFETVIKEKESGRELYVGQFDTLSEYMGHNNSQKRVIRQAIGGPRKPYPKTFQITDMCERVLDGEPVKEVYERLMEEYPDLNFKKSRHYRNNNVGQCVTLLLEREDVQTYFSEELISKRELYACNTVSMLVRLLEKTKRRYDQMMAERLQREVQHNTILSGMHRVFTDLIDNKIDTGEVLRKQRDKAIGQLMLEAGVSVDDVVNVMGKNKSTVKKWKEHLSKPRF